jgi:hypothetical protein
MTERPTIAGAIWNAIFEPVPVPRTPDASHGLPEPIFEKDAFGAVPELAEPVSGFDDFAVVHQSL